jgi:hypothetical protein
MGRPSYFNREVFDVNLLGFYGDAEGAQRTIARSRGVLPRLREAWLIPPGASESDI